MRPGDDFVTIELVHDRSLAPDDSDDFWTTWIVDPDGNRIELVQWPAGHADGIRAADWAS